MTKALEEFRLGMHDELVETRRRLGEEHKAHDLTKSELKDALSLLRQLVCGAEVCGVVDPVMEEMEFCGDCALCHARVLLSRLEPDDA